jgi:hypothetical protein
MKTKARRADQIQLRLVVPVHPFASLAVTTYDPQPMQKKYWMTGKLRYST